MALSYLAPIRFSWYQLHIIAHIFLWFNSEGPPSVPTYLLTYLHKENEFSNHAIAADGTLTKVLLGKPFWFRENILDTIEKSGTGTGYYKCSHVRKYRAEDQW
jgi:hypothetical protein